MYSRCTGANSSDTGVVVVFEISDSWSLQSLNRKRALAALMFLQLNGVRISLETETLYDLTMGVAAGRIDKATVAIELERIAKLGS